jgi:hypothetical protein
MPNKSSGVRPDAWKTRCPHCTKKLRFEKIPELIFRRTFDCPHCKTLLAIAVVQMEPKTPPDSDGAQPNMTKWGSVSPPNRSAPGAHTEDGEKSKGFSFKETDDARPKPAPLLHLDFDFDGNGSINDPLPVRKVVAPKKKDVPPPTLELEVVDDDMEDSEEPEYYDPKNKPTKTTSCPSQPLLSLRATRRLVSFLIWWGPMCFFMCGGMLVPYQLSGLFIIGGALSMLWLVVCAFIIFRLSRLITALLVSKFCCPGCHELIECVGTWNFGQFHDYKQRHVLLARDPHTGAWGGHVNCPFCDVTIFV